MDSPIDQFKSQTDFISNDCVSYAISNQPDICIQVYRNSDRIAPWIWNTQKQQHDESECYHISAGL